MIRSNNMTLPIKKKIANITPNTQVVLPSRRVSRTPNSNITGGNTTFRNEMNLGAEHGLKMSVKEKIKLFDLLELSSIPEKKNLKNLINSIKIPPRNLLEAFEQTSSRCNDTAFYLPSFNESNINVIYDDTPLLNFSDILSSTISTSRSSSLSSVPILLHTHVPNPYDKDNTQYICLSRNEDLYNKSFKHTRIKLEIEKKLVLETSLIYSVHSSFEKVKPLVKRFLAKSGPQTLRSIMYSKKRPGLPCPLEARAQVVQTLERLRKIHKEVATNFPVEDLGEILIDSVQNNVKTLDENLDSIDDVLDKIEQHYEFTNGLRHISKELKVDSNLSFLFDRCL